MNFLKTSAFLLGFAALGLACGDSSNNQPDAPIYGGNGGSHADAYIAPGTGGAVGTGGTTVAIDSGAGGATGVIDGSAGDTNKGIDSGPDGGTGTVEVGGEVGSVVDPKPVHIAIINAATASVGLTVAGPATVPYASCK